MATSSIKNLNDTTPAPNSGYQNGKWQQVSAGTDPTTGLPLFDGSVELPADGGVSKLTGSATAAAGDCGKLLSFTLTLVATYTLPATPPSVPDGGGTNRWKVALQNGPASSASLTVAATSPAKLDGTTAGSFVLNSALGCAIFTDGTDYFTERGNGPGTPSYPGTGSGSISQSTIPSTLNLTTEGIYDWLATSTFTGIPRTKAWPPPNSKMLGGYLFESFCWTTAASIFNFSGALPALTSTASDDTARGLSGFTTGVGLTATTDTGEGYCFKVPADTFQRVLRLYTGVFSGTITIVARASDGSFTDLTDTLVSAAGAGVGTVWKITYKTARDGQWLLISVRLTTNLGSTPNVTCQAITLAAV